MSLLIVHTRFVTIMELFQKTIVKQIKGENTNKTHFHKISLIFSKHFDNDNYDFF